MQAYRWTAERVLRELNSAPGGLSRKQAAARLAKHGENRLARKKGDSLWRRFMLQLSDPMILVLLAAAAVSAVLCVVHREFPADVLIIMTVVTVNAVLGVVQESKAEKAIAALQEMTPATSRVLRGGAECTVPSRTLVPGDVVLLSAGDRIPADCRVLESIGLRVEESALTGESQPVEKSAAIARQLGILEPEGEVLTGARLSQMDDRALDDAVARCSVFARVQPEHKVRIVEAFHRQGAVTAMTGDGVNDAPAIQAADIGVGMGMTGTDVTKNVADMVLTDDNFATIVAAVEEGRRVYDNIRKSIQFLLSSNLAEVLTILVATLLGFTILEPVHLLWINLITDCFPALALGMERGEPEIMRRRPRDPKDGIFAGGMGFDVAWQGLLVTAVTLLAYFSGLLLTCPVQMDWAALVHITDPLAHKTGMTMAFFTLSMAEIFHSFNMRSRRASLFSMGQNGYLWGAMVLSLVLSTVVLYVPALAAAFDFVPLSGTAYGASMALALAVIPVVELVKAVQRAVHR